MNRLSMLPRRILAINEVLRSFSIDGAGGSHRPKHERKRIFTKERIKHSDTKQHVRPRDEDYFKESKREFDPPRQQRRQNDNRRLARPPGGEFNRILESDAGLDPTEAEFLSQPPPLDARASKEYVEKKIRRQRSGMMTAMETRKYYDFPIEDNLLTWSGKEQIFRLRDSDPTTWTADRIAQSFPISSEGARRMLRRKWPPPMDGENEEELIKKHDEEVSRRWILLKKGKTEDGLVSELTLQMIRSGQVKFLPMFATGNSKLVVDEHEKDEVKIDEFSSTILPGDGPFVKLYKRHLRSLETSSSDSKSSAAASELDRSSVTSMTNSLQPSEKSEDALRAFVFPKDEDNDRVVQFDQFRLQLDRALGERNRPEDRKYREWMEKSDRKKKSADS